MKELKIRITEVKEVKTNDGKQFTAYKALTNDKRLIDCRFRKEVKNVPTEPCIIVVDEDKCNVATNKIYPILWVSEVKSIEPYVKESNANKYFG